MSFGKVISANDEVMVQPKIRKDQQRKCQNIVRANSNAPEIAVGLLRDYLKGHEDFYSVSHDKEEDLIKLSLKNHHSKMITTYTFRLKATTLLETPTI